MDEQNLQPVPPSTEPPLIAGGNASQDSQNLPPLSQSSRTRYFIAAILILAAALLGFWVWQNQFGNPPDGEAGPTSKLPPVEPPLAETSNFDASTWKTYRNEESGFEFQYPSDLIFQPVHTSFVSLADGVEADIPTSYNLPNSFQRSQKIYVGLTSAVDKEQCMPPKSSSVSESIAVPVNIGDVIFNEYHNGDCAMDGCGVGHIYKTWRNNKCYVLSSFYIQSSYSKYYSTRSSDPYHDPGYLAAEEDAKITTEKITDLIEGFLSTFRFID